MSIILRNGQTWENPAGERAIAQWLGGNLWCLLQLPSQAAHGGTEMLPMADGAGFTVWPIEELTRRIGADHWRRIPHFGMQLPGTEVPGPGDTQH